MSRVNLNQLKERIKKIRKTFNISKSEFAKRIGISPAYVTDLESGKKTNISLPLAKLISYEFGINPDWLLTGQGEMFIKPAVGKNEFLLEALSSHPTIEKIVLMLAEMPEEDICEIYKRVEEKITLKRLKRLLEERVKEQATLKRLLREVEELKRKTA